MNPSELAGLKFGDYYRLRVYDNNVWADKRGHLDLARPVVPGAPSAEDIGGTFLTCSVKLLTCSLTL